VWRIQSDQREQRYHYFEWGGKLLLRN